MKRNEFNKKDVKLILKAVEKPSRFSCKTTLDGIKKAKELLQQKVDEGKKFDGEKCVTICFLWM